MFGTIGHARHKAGRQSQLEALMQEWLETIRPQIPGEFVQLVGHADGQPEEVVFVALAQDKATYRAWPSSPSRMPGSAASPTRSRARCAGRTWPWRWFRPDQISPD